MTDQKPPAQSRWGYPCMQNCRETPAFECGGLAPLWAAGGSTPAGSIAPTRSLEFSFRMAVKREISGTRRSTVPQQVRRRARPPLRKAAPGRRTRNNGAAVAQVSSLFDPASVSAAERGSPDRPKSSFPRFTQFLPETQNPSPTDC